MRRWINQVGHYKLTKAKEKADDWIYFIDNSMRIENRKVFLILGSRLSKLKKGKYLSYEDLEPIAINIIEKNSEIEKVIENAIAETGNPIQICSDTGSDIMPSVRKIISKNPKTKHIPDIMHKTGNMLKKKLENDIRWKTFINFVNDSKRRLCLSSLSFICPPNLRGKSRFFNCQNVLEWANRALIVLAEMTMVDPKWYEMNEKLGWLIGCKQNIALFTELFRMTALAKEIVRKLHIGRDVCEVAEELLKEEVKTEEGLLFANGILDFLKEQCNKTDEGILLVGSSEIIESAFSKLKLLDRECGNSGFTSSVLGLAACFGPTDFKSIEAAFEESDFKDVVKWGEEHVGETIQKKRRKVLKFQKREDLNSKLTRFFDKKTAAA